MLIALLVLITATIYEIFCVALIYYANQDKAFMAGIVSMLAGQCSVTAWLLSIDQKIYVPFMIVGWGLGAYIGVKWKLGNKK